MVATLFGECRIKATAGMGVVTESKLAAACDSRARTSDPWNTKDDPMAFPGVRGPMPAIAEDCGQPVICFSFPKHHLGCKARSAEPLPESTTTL